MEAIQNTGNFPVLNSSDYDRAEELKLFLETKAGVKGLVDSGIVKVPGIFIQSPENLPKSSPNSNGVTLKMPVINLTGLENDQMRKAIVNEIREAAKTWGFFQMINHGVPIDVIDNGLEGVRQFHEEPLEVKSKFYAVNGRKQVMYNSNASLNPLLASNWRDSLTCRYLDQNLDEEALPQVSRRAISEYVKQVYELKETLSELLSEALGLSSHYLENIECMKSASFVGNYYPACPEPDLALGIGSHSDKFFLTILAQDNIGGLQVLHQNQWIDVPYMRGALIANIGDMMQLISNDKFRSMVHRVRARATGPRTSIACIFFPSMAKSDTPYGPVREILTDDNPAFYQEVSMYKYFAHCEAKGLVNTPNLCDFRI